MKIFHLLILIIFSNLLTSESEIEFSLNSDSIWRGITQNNGKPTVGANIYFSLDNGFFSGAWIENCCSGNSSYPHREIGYEFGYELLVVNACFSFIGMYILSIGVKTVKT